jgi:hypothetical protein
MIGRRPTPKQRKLAEALFILGLLIGKRISKRVVTKNQSKQGRELKTKRNEFNAMESGHYIRELGAGGSNPLTPTNWRETARSNARRFA